MTTREINLLGIRKRVILARFNIGKFTECAVMDEINSEQEKHIDNTESHILPNGSTISKRDIYFYGDINLNDFNDISLIREKKLIDEDSSMRSDFDYEKGCHYVYDRVKDTITNDALTWFKYNHCLLGKPKKIVVYKYPLKMLR